MANQTSVAGSSVAGHNGAEAPARAISRNVSDFAHDISTLADLQWQLASVDLKQALRKLTLPAILLVAAIGLILGAIPVMFLGVGYLLVEYTELSVGWACLVAALGGLIVAGLFAAIGYVRLTHSFDVLHRSREELARNFNWIKSVLQHPRRVPPEPVRTR